MLLILWGVMLLIFKNKQIPLKGKSQEIKYCVYFLFKNDKIIYIGKTYQLKRRVGEHFRKIDFDYYSYMEMPCFMLNKAERYLIEKYRPELNGEYISPKIKNKNIRRKPNGPTIDIRTKLPQHFEAALDKKAEEYGFSRNETAKLLIIEGLRK